MKITIKPEVFKKHPDLKLVFILASEIDNHSKLKESKYLLQEIEQLQRLTIHKDKVKTHHLLSPWSLAQREFGKKAHHYHTSVEKLLTKVLRRKTTATKNAFTNILNFMMLKHTIPGGALDFHKVDGDITYSLASGREKKGMTAKVKKGDIIYKDKTNLLGSKLDAYNAKKSMITKYSSKALVHFDILPPVTAKETSELMQESTDLLKEFCEAKCDIFILDKKHKKHTI